MTVKATMVSKSTASFIAIALSFSLAASLSAQERSDWYKANVAYDSGDYSTALAIWRPRAEKGEATSQHALGVMYDQGQGVPKDAAMAAVWFRKAAEQGWPLSQFRLGLSYELGEGVGQSSVDAANWYRKAAESGLTPAQHKLGVAYSSGLGVPRNYTEAAKWFRLAAEKGFVSSQFVLGLLYLGGKGLPTNHVEGYKWLLLSEAGEKTSLDVAHDKKKVQQTIAETGKLLSSTEIAEAQKLAREWKPTK